MTAKSSPGLTTPETSRRRDRFSLTTCNPRKISCTGRESSGYTNCNAELSTLEQTNVWLRISFRSLADGIGFLGSLNFNSIDHWIEFNLNMNISIRKNVNVIRKKFWKILIDRFYLIRNWEIILLIILLVQEGIYIKKYCGKSFVSKIFNAPVISA